MSDYDVIVVGSGVSGLSSAWHMAEDHDVLVIDEDAVGNGTSSRASGVIMTPIDYPEWPEWTEHAVSWFEELDGRGVLNYTEREYVRGIRPEEVEGARDVAKRQWVSLRDPDEYDKWDDTFDDDSPYEKVLVWDENTGYLDVDELLPTLEHMAIQRGAEMRPDTEVEEVLVEDGEAVGVETEWRTVSGDQVVVAAGSGTRPLLSDVLPLPIRKFVWNVAYLDIGLPDDYPMGGDAQEEIYWRPTRDNQLLIGIEHHYGQEDKPRERREGSDRGSAQAEPTGIRGDHHMEIAPGLENLLNDDVPQLMKHVETADDAVRWEVCPMADSTTPDAKPIIDAPDEGPDDLVVAAGFHGAGVMSTKSIGAAVRSYLTDEECPFPRDPMKLDRFDTRDTDFDFAPMTSWQSHMT
jgi:glycine/D-amino acid oxidase-like deaminating enzyme